MTHTPLKLEERLMMVGSKSKEPIDSDVRTIYDLIERLEEKLGLKGFKQEITEE
jgi:hypothetical protein